MKGKLTIKADIPEQNFMEGLLNMKHSGSEVMLPLSLYALCHQWHIGKLIYYKKLLDSGDEII